MSAPTPFPPPNYHHSTACHCSCHHAQSSQHTQAQHSRPSQQSNAQAQTELSQLLNGIQDYFRSLYTPPQVRVTRSGFWSSQSMAFGRESLSTLSYDEAETLFRSTFESEDDKVKVPLPNTNSSSSSNSSATGEKGSIRVIPSIMEIHATFLREPRGSTDTNVVLHRSAWPEVMENVKALSVVFRKGKVEETQENHRI